MIVMTAITVYRTVASHHPLRCKKSKTLLARIPFAATRSENFYNLNIEYVKKPVMNKVLTV